MSRNTVAKWLRAQGNKESKYRRRTRANKLSAFEETLRQALAVDARRPKRQRHTALHAQIKAEGYTGGYSAVSNFARLCKLSLGQSAHVKAHVPLK